jgi:hypothetical protein
MSDLATSEEEGLTAILQALANPAARHFIELLALAPRTHDELRAHFDLRPGELTAMRRTLYHLGMVENHDSRMTLDRAGLDRVQRWLDRIAEIERHSDRSRLED